MVRLSHATGDQQSINVAKVLKLDPSGGLMVQTLTVNVGASVAVLDPVPQAATPKARLLVLRTKVGIVRRRITPLEGRRSINDGVPLGVCPRKAVSDVVACSATAQASVLRSSNLFLEEPNRFLGQFDLAIRPTADVVNAVHRHVLLCMLVLIEIAAVGEHRDYADRGVANSPFAPVTFEMVEHAGKGRADLVLPM